MSGPSKEEKIAAALAAYAREEINELGVAAAMEMPIETDNDKLMAIKSVKNLTQANIKMRDQAVVAKPHGITSVHGDGRTQIPKIIREFLGVQDGSYLFWYEINGKIVVSARQIDSGWMGGHFAFDASKTRPK
jgi:hypothetical protein